MNQPGGFAATRIGMAIASLGGLALLAWVALRPADRADRAAHPAAPSDADNSQATVVQVLTPDVGLLAAEVSREEPSTPAVEVASDATTPWPPTDDDYRAGRLRALKAALKSLHDPAISVSQRITNAELLATASVATLLDAQGAYEDLPRGQRSRVVFLPGHERVNFNSRVYHVDLEAYPEFHEARRLMWSLHETTAAPRPLNAPNTEVSISDELLLQIAARALEAIQVVEGDLVSKRIRFQ